MRSIRSDPPKLSITDRNLPLKYLARDRPRLLPPTISTPIQSSSSLVPFLGPDSWLTSAKCQCCLDLGLYMCCGQSGYLARNCPKQVARNLPTAEAHGALINFSPLPELSKNKTAVLSAPGRMTVSLSFGNLYWNWALLRLDLQKLYILSCVCLAFLGSLEAW